MKAEVDRIVVASGTLHRPIPRRRDPADWSRWRRPVPGAVVRQRQREPVFPGPDAHVEHVQRESGDASGQQSSAASRTQPTKRWTVDIYLYEDKRSNVGQRCPAQ